MKQEMLYPNAQLYTGKKELAAAEQIASLKAGDLALISFSIRADRCTKMEVTVENDTPFTVPYFANPQWSRVVLPFQANALRSITALIPEPLFITDIKFENLGAVSIDTTDEYSGQHLIEDVNHIFLPEKGVGIGPVSYLVKSGSFIYAISTKDGGMLTVVDVTDRNNPKIRGRLQGLGKDTRRAALCASGTDLMVVSREDGAYILDVSDPDCPRFRSHYNSVEFATGIAIEGNTAYLSNREYGVEVVDLTDLDHPVERAVIHGGVVQNCCACNEVLYCGCFADMCVDMYDISHPDTIRKIGSVPLGGKGDSMAARTIGGKTYLYAATSQHSHHKVGYLAKAVDGNFGQGNGLDIFDVTDPKNPQWLSTSRIDGRYYFANSDYWDVRISVQGEKVTAYYVDTFTGLYILDVSDPTAPVRLAHVDIPITTASPNYRMEAYPNRDHIFPYDQAKGSQSPIGIAEIEDGAAYLAGIYTDLHIFKNAELLHSTAAEPVKKAALVTDDHLFAFDGKGLAEYKCVSTGEMTEGIARHGETIITGAGKSIRFYTPDLTLLAVIPTEYDCYDVAVNGDILYSAEGTNGLVAYRINGTGLEKLWAYKKAAGTVRSVEVTENGKYIGIQAGDCRYELISAVSHEKLADGEIDMMYFRNVEQFGSCLGFWGYPMEYWYDCRDESGLAPKQVNSFKSLHGLMTRGTMSSSGYIMVHDKGYYCEDPLTTAGKAGKPELIFVCENFGGMPTVSGNLMVCCDRIKRLIFIVNIRDVQKPELLAAVEIPGNPDAALIAGNTVFVPAGQMGLLKFSLTPYRV